MFMSLSSTTRTRATLSVMTPSGVPHGWRRHGRFGIGLGEELRIEFDLGCLPHQLDLVEGGLLLHALGDARPYLLERLRGMRADLEDVDAEARGDGIAGLAGLELRHARLELGRQHARAERAEDAAAFGAAGIVRVLPGHLPEVRAALQLR